MTVTVKKIPKERWAQFSEDAHRAVFDKIKPAEFDRIDYAWLAVEADEKPVGYVTVRELDHETVYWAYGGAFQWARKSLLAAKTYELLIAAQRAAGSRRILTYIEPDNVNMLRLAMAHGFRICGYRARGTINLVDLVLELA